MAISLSQNSGKDVAGRSGKQRRSLSFCPIPTATGAEMRLQDSITAQNVSANLPSSDGNDIVQYRTLHGLVDSLDRGLHLFGNRKDNGRETNEDSTKCSEDDGLNVSSPDNVHISASSLSSQDVSTASHGNDVTRSHMPEESPASDHSLLKNYYKGYVNGALNITKHYVGPKKSSTVEPSHSSDRCLVGETENLAYPKKHSNQSQPFQGLPSLEEKRKKVGHYLLGRTLGEGSFAKVKIATHLISKQQVAIKVVAKRVLVLREAARRHFRREALLLQKVSHPNIVRLYEAMETSNSYYLVFELVHGSHLLAYLRERGRLSEEESRQFLRQISSAVDHLHTSGIVHRDLKLENFLLESGNKIKLVDLGLSALCHGWGNQLSTQCGSPVYAAPEIFAGRKYGKPVDVWSLGVCLFAMLTGRLPFRPLDEGSLSQLYSLIVKGLEIPGHLSPSCHNLLRRMLNLQESRRISIEDILSHHWLMYPDGQPIKRYPPISKTQSASSINNNIVKHMCRMFRFSESDVISSVLARKLSPSAATYNIWRDSIEAGKAVTPFTNDISSINGKNGCSRRNTTIHPRCDPTQSVLTTSSASSSSSSISQQKDLHGNNNLEECIESVVNTTESQNVSRQDALSTQNSYKSCIRDLRRVRLLLPETDIENDQPIRSDYVVVGRSPYNNKEGNDASVPVLPSIITGLPRKNIGSEVHGRSQPLRLATAQSLNFSVKGVSPWIQQNRNDSSCPSADVPTMYKHAYPPLPMKSNQKDIDRIVDSSEQSPPPAPPNSSFGSQSLFSKSPVSQSFQHQSRDVTSTTLRRQPQAILPSPQLQPRAASEPPRPSLSYLRDPFGRETWSKRGPGAHTNMGTGGRHGRISSAIFYAMDSVLALRNKKSEDLHDASLDEDIPEVDDYGALICEGHGTQLHTDRLSPQITQDYAENDQFYIQATKREKPSENFTSEAMATDVHTISLGNQIFNNEEMRNSQNSASAPGSPRPRIGSPLSQSEEREDYFTPVTRVTIKVRN